MKLFLYPLQSLNEFNISSYSDNIGHIAAFIGGIIIIVGIIIFLNVSKRVQQSNAFSTGKLEHHKKTSTDIKFEEIAKKYKLTHEELRSFRKLFESGRDDPIETIADPNALDDIFKSAYHNLIPETDSSKTALTELCRLFSVRNTIEFFQKSSKPHKKAIRSYNRRKIDAACTCTPVVLTKEKGKFKSVKKFVLSGESFNCELCDISVGGCAYSSTNPAKTGSMIKIEFVIGTRKIAVLGRILRVNKDTKGTVYHVQFLKIQPKSLCIVNAYVFSYI